MKLTKILLLKSIVFVALSVFVFFYINKGTRLLSELLSSPIHEIQL
jgi:hypothetical protein